MPGCVAIHPGLGRPAEECSTTIAQPWQRGLATSLSSSAPAKHSSAVDSGSTELSIGASSWVVDAAQLPGEAAAAASGGAAAAAAVAAAARGCAAARRAASLKRCVSARASTWLASGLSERLALTQP